MWRREDGGERRRGKERKGKNRKGNEGRGVCVPDLSVEKKESSCQIQIYPVEVKLDHLFPVVVSELVVDSPSDPAAAVFFIISCCYLNVATKIHPVLLAELTELSVCNPVKCSETTCVQCI